MPFPGRKLGARVSARPGISRLGVGSRPGFSSPLSISGLGIWYDAADVSTFTFNGGDVSRVNDKSVNGIDARAVCATNQPTTNTVNGKQVLEFRGNGSKDFFDLTLINTLTLGPKMTMIMVATKSANQAYLIATDGGSAAPAFLSLFDPGGGAVDLEYFNQGGRLTLASSTDSNLHILAATVDQTGNTTVFFDGIQQGQSATADTFAGDIWSAMGRPDTFDGQYFDGFVGDFIFYKKILNAIELGQLVTFLKDKWAI